MSMRSALSLLVVLGACSMPGHRSQKGGEPGPGFHGPASAAVQGPQEGSTQVTNGSIHNTGSTESTGSTVAASATAVAAVKGQPLVMGVGEGAIAPACPGCLPRPHLPVTPEVQRELERFTERDRSFIVSSLRSREKYYQDILTVFRNEGVPEELVNVAAIESRFSPNALSPAGALGMWQFIRSTAQLYGLKTGRAGDERRDPVRSAKAAARHLKDLYNSFGDWFLALAAYNAGLGCVTRALSRSDVSDFWTLARGGKLSRETANYVPRFIAVTLIINDLEKYGFEKPISGIG